MIDLYIFPHDKPSLKAKQWLENYQLPFEEFNLLDQGLHLRALLVKVIPLMEVEIEELLSKRSRQYQRIKPKINDMPLSQLIDYLALNPRILRHPLLFDGSKFQIGFNPDEIRKFIPRDVRQIEFELAQDRLGREQALNGTRVRGPYQSKGMRF